MGFGRMGLEHGALGLAHQYRLRHVLNVQISSLEVRAANYS